MNTEDIKTILRNIPNSVSGDGKTFVAALKNYLTKYGIVTDEKIDSALEELTKKPNHVDSITLLELHAITDGVRSNNIQINWDTTPVNDYAKAEIWYTRSGADSAWEKAGEANGTQYVLQGATAGETYHIRVIAVNSKGVAADFDTAPIANITIKGSQYIPSPPTQFVLTWDEQGPLWKWLFEDNNYVDFFELRLDQNPGVWNDKRLDSTRETWSRANPDVRAGTAYLYIRNIFGEYSEPAVHEFNKAMPGKPEAPVLTATLDGVRIKMEPLPQGNTGYKMLIRTKDSSGTVSTNFFTTVNSEYIYFFFEGVIAVKYCFIDDLGEGEWSDAKAAQVKDLVVEENNIAAGAITQEKIAANAVTAAAIAANAVTSTKISAGAVTADKIEAGAITAEKLAAGSVTSDAIQAGSVVGDKIAANSISGKHLSAENIDLLGALAVTGGAVKLSEEGLRCTEESGGYTLFDERGITFYDKNGNQYSQLHRICVGTAAHGSHVAFTAPWIQAPKVICVPTELQCSESQYAQSNIFIICRATNITVNGFDVNCYTRLGEGSSVTIPYNEDYAGATTENIKVIDRYNFEAYFDKELTVPKSATEGTVIADLTSRATGSYHLGKHQSYSSRVTQVYKMQIIYQADVIAETDYTTLPQTYGDNYDEKRKTRQKLSFQLPSATDYEVKVTLRIVLAKYLRKRMGGVEGTTSATLESDAVMLISTTYNSGTFIISTGSAAFIAIENANSDFSNSEATWSIRQDT